MDDHIVGGNGDNDTDTDNDDNNIDGGTAAANCEHDSYHGRRGRSIGLPNNTTHQAETESFP